MFLGSLQLIFDGLLGKVDPIKLDTSFFKSIDDLELLWVFALVFELLIPWFKPVRSLIGLFRNVQDILILDIFQVDLNEFAAAIINLQDVVTDLENLPFYVF